jgi:hypothetical protein
MDYIEKIAEDLVDKATVRHCQKINVKLFLFTETEKQTQ